MTYQFTATWNVEVKFLDTGPEPSPIPDESVPEEIRHAAVGTAVELYHVGEDSGYLYWTHYPELVDMFWSDDTYVGCEVFYVCIYEVELQDEQVAEL